VAGRNVDADQPCADTACETLDEGNFLTAREIDPTTVMRAAREAADECQRANADLRAILRSGELSGRTGAECVRTARLHAEACKAKAAAALAELDRLPPAQGPARAGAEVSKTASVMEALSNLQSSLLTKKAALDCAAGFGALTSTERPSPRWSLE
jgi:hypothetical protein